MLPPHRIRPSNSGNTRSNDYRFTEFLGEIEMRNANWSNSEAVEVWMSARPTRNPIVEYLRDYFDFGDMHGSTMGALFAIADAMTDLDPDLVPSEWEFRQAAGGSDIEDANYIAITEAMAAGATVEDLKHAGAVFSRLDSMNRLTGIDY
jgi:hypothetical protein